MQICFDFNHIGQKYNASVFKQVEDTVQQFCSNMEKVMFEPKTNGLNFKCLKITKEGLCATFSKSQRKNTNYVFFVVNLNDFDKPRITKLYHNTPSKKPIGDSSMFYETEDVTVKFINSKKCALERDMDPKMFIRLCKDWFYVVVERNTNKIIQIIGLESKKKEIGHIWNYVKSLYDVEEHFSNS